MKIFDGSSVGYCSLPTVVAGTGCFFCCLTLYNYNLVMVEPQHHQQGSISFVKYEVSRSLEDYSLLAHSLGG